MTWRERRETTKNEFETWCKDYPRKLESRLVTIGDPPIKHVVDNSLDDTDWSPATVVAAIEMGWLGPNGEVDYSGSAMYWKYFVCESALSPNS